MVNFQPDETDWAIIEILRREHVTNSAVAEQLGISEGTVRSRLKRLREAEILSVRALINTEVLANQQLAQIAINVSESRLLEEKAMEIQGLENVLSVSIVSGRYDLLVEVLVDSNRGLVEFLTKTLSQVEGISATESFVTLKSFRKYV
ncbi:MAG: Lrp/AsnC family transcriptional regulator [Planctomycetota bacterium]|jgi:Lrp/AsnC family transcriptional regulator for asnA, asnC and gidA